MKNLGWVALGLGVMYLFWRRSSADGAPYRSSSNQYAVGGPDQGSGVKRDDDMDEEGGDGVGKAISTLANGVGGFFASLAKNNAGSGSPSAKELNKGYGSMSQRDDTRYGEDEDRTGGTSGARDIGNDENYKVPGFKEPKEKDEDWGKEGTDWYWDSGSSGGSKKGSSKDDDDDKDEAYE